MPEPTRVQQLQAALSQAKARLTVAEAQLEEMRGECWQLAGRLQEAIEFPPAKPDTSAKE